MDFNPPTTSDYAFGEARDANAKIADLEKRVAHLVARIEMISRNLQATFNSMLNK